jgi:hypothetical protein
MNPDQLDQLLGSMMEAWINRDVDEDQCRFCNERLEEATPAAERYCSVECEQRMETVLEARVAIGNRDMEQRGYD